MSKIEDDGLSSLYILLFPENRVLKIGKANDIYKRSLILKKFWGVPDYSNSYELVAPQSSVFRLEKSLHFLLDNSRLQFESGDGRTELFKIESLNLVLEYLKLYTESSTEQLTLKQGITLQEKEELHYIVLPKPVKAVPTNLKFQMFPDVEPYGVRRGFPVYRGNPSKLSQVVISKEVVLDVMLNLSKSGKDVRAIVLSKIDSKREFLILPFDPDAGNLSLSKFRKGIRELLLKGIIFNSIGEGVYFPNVHFI